MKATFLNSKYDYRIITKFYVISARSFSTQHCKTALNLLVPDYSAIQLIPVLRGFDSTVMLPVFSSLPQSQHDPRAGMMHMGVAKD